MRKILSVILLLWAGCISSQAQVLNPGRNLLAPFPQVKAYLGLTDAQVTQIVLNLDDYTRLAAQRQQRVFQVQTEIQQETAKSPLDPAALGIRYAEIESICRNVRDEGIAAQNQNLTVLTDAQKAKLKVLEDASKLFPIVNEAQNAGLLAPAGPYSNFGSQWFNSTAFVTPVLLSGCQQPVVPTTIIRTGDFSGTPYLGMLQASSKFRWCESFIR